MRQFDISEYKASVELAKLREKLAFVLHQQDAENAIRAIFDIAALLMIDCKIDKEESLKIFSGIYEIWEK